MCENNIWMIWTWIIHRFSVNEHVKEVKLNHSFHELGVFNHFALLVFRDLNIHYMTVLNLSFN